MLSQLQQNCGAVTIGRSWHAERSPDLPAKSLATPLEWRVEETCAKAWPALREVPFGDWVLRMAPGVSRRANSSIRCGPGRAMSMRRSPRPAPLEEHGQPMLFRVLTPLLDPGVDRRLTALGFSAEGQTVTLYADSAGVTPDRDPRPRHPAAARPRMARGDVRDAGARPGAARRLCPYRQFAGGPRGLRQPRRRRTDRLGGLRGDARSPSVYRVRRHRQRPSRARPGAPHARRPFRLGRRRGASRGSACRSKPTTPPRSGSTTISV